MQFTFRKHAIFNVSFTPHFIPMFHGEGGQTNYPLTGHNYRYALVKKKKRIINRNPFIH